MLLVGLATTSYHYLRISDSKAPKFLSSDTKYPQRKCTVFQGKYRDCCSCSPWTILCKHSSPNHLLGMETHEDKEFCPHFYHSCHRNGNCSKETGYLTYHHALVVVGECSGGLWCVFCLLWNPAWPHLAILFFGLFQSTKSACSTTNSSPTKLPFCKKEALIVTVALSEQHESDCGMLNHVVGTGTGTGTEMQEATWIQYPGYRPFWEPFGVLYLLENKISLRHHVYHTKA